MKNSKILYNNSGEGHIDTGLKIIIAVVIGALILGGLYALFSLVVFPRLNENVQNMMHYEEEASIFRFDAFDTSVASLQYSYDGTTWVDATIPEFSDNAKIVKTTNTSEPNFSLALINDNGEHYIIMTEDNGKTWTTTYRAGKYNLGGQRVEYSLRQNVDNSFSMAIRTYDGRTATSGSMQCYKSTDGRSWQRDGLPWDMF